MKNILDYRLVILDNDGQLIKYEFSNGMHDSCLEHYAKDNKYQYSNKDYLVGMGNGIFYNCGNGIVVVMLPNKLNDEQLYSLDYVENWLDNVSWMEVSIKDVKGVEIRKFLFKEDIKENFSNEVIQYYYNSGLLKKR